VLLGQPALGSRSDQGHQDVIDQHSARVYVDRLDPTDSLIGVRRSLLLASPLPSATGYSWTLATRLGEMLAMAEDRYGPRNRDFTPLGVEFVAGPPQIWFPGDRWHVVIQLGLECLSDPLRACYQLAHECIHLLSPVPHGNITVLEDGLATHFAKTYLRTSWSVWWAASGHAAYDAACARVEALLAIDPDAVKHLRATEPIISRISAELIQQAYPPVSADDARVLAAPFERDVP
jgi:hypothetical protein